MLPAASLVFKFFQSLPCQNEPSQNSISASSTRKSGEPYTFGCDLYLIPAWRNILAVSSSSLVPLLLMFRITSDRFSLENTSATTIFCVCHAYLKILSLARGCPQVTVQIHLSPNRLSSTRSTAGYAEGATRMPEVVGRTVPPISGVCVFRPRQCLILRQRPGPSSAGCYASAAHLTNMGGGRCTPDVKMSQSETRSVIRNHAVPAHGQPTAAPLRGSRLSSSGWSG